MLVELTQEDPENGLLNYHCACSFDALGFEKEAIPYYRQAVELGLPEEENQSAYLGLGSSYRALGLYAESKETLEMGIGLYPENNALKAFYAMTLYNLGDTTAGVEILLKLLASTSDDPHIQRYKKALLFYADNLDTVWD